MEATDKIPEIIVKIKLKKHLQVELNEWYCTINGQNRIVTNEYVQYNCLDIEAAAKSFKKDEVEFVIISAKYNS